MISAPVIVESEALPAAVIHITGLRAQIHDAMGIAFREVLSGVAEQGIGPAGPLFAHHLVTSDEAYDIEVGVPVTGPVTPAGRLIAGELPSAKVARAVYHGGYAGLYGAWSEFDEWVVAQGLKARGDLWEVYTTGPEASDDPATWVTELDLPLV
jgi:effector-binding domain-containing protein